MSASDNFYLEKGFTPTWKTVVLDGVGTITAWTPRTSTRIVLTGITYASTLAGSTAFYFGNLAGTKITEIRHGGSFSIYLPIHADSNIPDRVLCINSVAPGTDGVKITLEGFESAVS